MPPRAGGTGDCVECGKNKRLILRNSRVVVRGHTRKVAGSWVTCPGSNQPPKQ